MRERAVIRGGGAEGIDAQHVALRNQPGIDRGDIEAQRFVGETPRTDRRRPVDARRRAHAANRDIDLRGAGQPPALRCEDDIRRREIEIALRTQIERIGLIDRDTPVMRRSAAAALIPASTPMR